MTSGIGSRSLRLTEVGARSTGRGGPEGDSGDGSVGLSRGRWAAGVRPVIHRFLARGAEAGVPSVSHSARGGSLGRGAASVSTQLQQRCRPLGACPRVAVGVGRPVATGILRGAGDVSLRVHPVEHLGSPNRRVSAQGTGGAARRRVLHPRGGAGVQRSCVTTVGSETASRHTGLCHPLCDIPFLLAKRLLEWQDTTPRPSSLPGVDTR